MSNENTFKIIAMEDAISDYKHGHISEEQLIEECRAILRGGESGSIEFNAGEEVTDIKFVGDGK